MITDKIANYVAMVTIATSHSAHHRSNFIVRSVAFLSYPKIPNYANLISTNRISQ